jgi:hypothetical protein
MNLKNFQPVNLETGINRHGYGYYLELHKQSLVTVLLFVYSDII